jgi:hypothetical protein
MKYRILTNNCLHVKDVESPLTLVELQCELEGKRWLRVEGAIIATQSIDAIVEVEEENNE